MFSSLVLFGSKRKPGGNERGYIDMGMRAYTHEAVKKVVAY